MRFYSTNNRNLKASLKEAVNKATATDNGLFMPAEILNLSQNFLNNIEKKSFMEIALEVAKTLFKGSILEKELKKIVKKTITFKCPLKKISHEKNVEIYALELFHGPTLAFKDFGARFMANLMAHLLKKSKTKLHILAATSGDTGSAVGQAFFKIPNIKVSLLYPSGKISKTQEQQITTIGQNVEAIEVKGTFDDCQKLVKAAFADAELRKNLAKKNVLLSSANSINIARLLPQTFYYFYAYSQLKRLHPDIRNHQIVVSVPSGNLGNLTAGLIAKKMGLPIDKFISATNKNDSFTKFITTGKFKAKRTIPTISNAMDVGNPNNLIRIQDLYNYDLKKIRQNISSKSFSDQQTKKALQKVFKKHKYVMDPHGAVGYLGLTDYLKTMPIKEKFIGIFFETAHPAKFADIVEPIIQQKIELPTILKNCLKEKKKSLKKSKAYNQFKDLLLSYIYP